MVLPQVAVMGREPLPQDTMTDMATWQHREAVAVEVATTLPILPSQLREGKN